MITNYNFHPTFDPGHIYRTEGNMAPSGWLIITNYHRIIHHCDALYFRQWTMIIE